MKKHLKINDKGRDFVVGDLHGCHSLLNLALDHVRFDPSIDRLISVGDLVDRGPDSMKCLKLLAEPWFHAVMGNHEDMMLQAVNGNPGWSNIWTMNGGQWAFSEDRAELVSLVRAYCDLNYLITVDLPDNKMFHVLHAELWADHPLSDAELLDDFDQLAFHNVSDGEICIWGRTIFRSLYNQHLTERSIAKWRRGAELEKVGVWCNSDTLSNIYCGHSIMRKPTAVGKLVNIDTGAFLAYQKKDSYGLTLTEPLTNRFWTTNLDGTTEVTPIIVL